MNSLRRAFIAIAVLAMAAVLASPALAQARTAVPRPVSVASLMNLELYLEAFGAKGDNIISIPGVGPMNENASNSAGNGFKQICRRFGIDGSPSAILQFNAQTGTITTYTCDQISAPVWTPGEAAMVRPSGVAAPITGRIPGVESAWEYNAYGEGAGALGDNLYPVPLTLATSSPEGLCGMLNLPAGSQILQLLAGPGNINTHLCGAAPTFSLRLGEGVLIRPTGTPGAKVATGTPTLY